MVIELIVVGKTVSPEIDTLVAGYQKRVNRYARFNIITVPDAKTTKGMTPADVRKAEAIGILKQLNPADHVVLLDEKGGELRSVDFARGYRGV